MRCWFMALVCVVAFSGIAIGADCVPIADPELADLTCRVGRSGAIAGSGNTLLYQVQEYRDGDTILGGGVAVLDTGRQIVLTASAEDADFDAPTEFKNRFGTFLDLGAHTRGTGQFPLGSLFRRDGAVWTKIDVEAWQSDLGNQLPKGMSVWRGPYPDYPHLAATAVVRREPPASGADPDVDYEGYAAVLLTLDRNRLAIETAAWKLGSDGPCAVMPNYPGCGGKSDAH